MNELLALLGFTQPPFPQQERTVEDLSFSPIRSALEGMNQKEQDSFIKKLLKNLEITGGYEKFGDQYTDGETYGGRLGYNLPLDDKSAVRAGVSGGGFKINTPIGTVKDSEITGGDIGYRFGPNDISLSYTSRGALPLTQIPMQIFERNQFDPMNAQQVKDLWQILYRRQF